MYIYTYVHNIPYVYIYNRLHLVLSHHQDTEALRSSYCPEVRRQMWFLWLIFGLPIYFGEHKPEPSIMGI